MGYRGPYVAIETGARGDIVECDRGGSPTTAESGGPLRKLERWLLDTAPVMLE